MLFSEKQIKELTNSVHERLSEKRFKHTIGVLRAAEKIGKYFPHLDLSELSAAALLHDITKELSENEHRFLFERECFELSESDKLSPAIFHSLSAPFAVKSDFSDFATENVLSAVKNHTTGSEDMSLFDEIIMIADYVEDSRIYESCVAVRDELFRDLSESRDVSECTLALHNAVYKSLVFTENDVIKRGRYLNERSLTSKKYFEKLLNL